MAPGDPLHPGKQLVIWVRAATAPAGSAALRLPQFEHPLAEQTVRRVRYSVRNGDSLYLIARRFQVEVNDIARWNSLDTADVLRPGRRLTLYVDVLHSGG
jgi:membrane-bound lytic murein transglycosylase D